MRLKNNLYMQLPQGYKNVWDKIHNVILSRETMNRQETRYETYHRNIHVQYYDFISDLNFRVPIWSIPFVSVTDLEPVWQVIEGMSVKILD